MNLFEVLVLGCGSATPTATRHPSSQLLTINGKHFLIDCGEGTQHQLKKYGASLLKINGIFITHLHGDHFFGIFGLLSTFSLKDRRMDLDIYAPKELEEKCSKFISDFCQPKNYAIHFHSTGEGDLFPLYENKSIEIYSFPLNHRIPARGFLFKEKPKLRHIIPEMIDFYNIPRSMIPLIKSGENFTTESGEIIENSRLTKDPAPPRSFAYCSDTAPSKAYYPAIEGVNLLYHEATFCDSEIQRAAETKHTTSRQAAEIAKTVHAKELLIGHFSARYKNLTELYREAKSVFPNVILAEEGKIYSVK